MATTVVLEPALPATKCKEEDKKSFGRATLTSFTHFQVTKMLTGGFLSVSFVPQRGRSENDLRSHQTIQLQRQRYFGITRRQKQRHQSYKRQSRQVPKFSIVKIDHRTRIIHWRTRKSEQADFQLLTTSRKSN